VLQIGRSLVRSQLVSLEFLIDIKSFRSHYGPGVDSASNRNEYQEHFLGSKGGQCVRLTTLPPSCAVVIKSGNLNFVEPSGPLQACNGTALPFTRCFDTVAGVGLWPRHYCSMFYSTDVKMTFGRHNMHVKSPKHRIFVNGMGTSLLRHKRLCCEVVHRCPKIRRSQTSFFTEV